VATKDRIQLLGWILSFVATKKTRVEIELDELGLGPVLVIAEEVAFVPVVHGSFQEQPSHS
jgi:hypothetical protein